MKAYYHARAPEYDDWWLGRGSYAERDRPGFEEELTELRVLLEGLPPVRTLDVGCGTGFLTRHLRGDVVGLDSSVAMIAVAKRQVPEARFVVGDALDLPFPDGSFDRVFASFFYCHLVEEERTRFLDEARRAAAELVVVGTVWNGSDPPERWEERAVSDGSRWRIFKRVFEPLALADELDGEVLYAGSWFVVVRS